MSGVRCQETGERANGRTGYWMLARPPEADKPLAGWMLEVRGRRSEVGGLPVRLRRMNLWRAQGARLRA
ncbi:hypothetical protein D3OALGA1CA_2912 [Olavius algarvensis associated proteobacterium Delta 3]|nr:hypothetical protein D3OALGA1CA_2912 [Olavius algarvensis associated proteobacterium Delta 3]